MLAFELVQEGPHDIFAGGELPKIEGHLVREEDGTVGQEGHRQDDNGKP